jgi:hypothetical protein
MMSDSLSSLLMRNIKVWPSGAEELVGLVIACSVTTTSGPVSTWPLQSCAIPCSVNKRTLSYRRHREISEVMLCDALTLGGLQYFMSFRYTQVIGAFVVVVVAIVIVSVGHITATSVSVSHLCFGHATSSRNRHSCDICMVTWIRLVFSDAMHSPQMSPERYLWSNCGGTLRVWTSRRPLEYRLQVCL